MFYSLALSASLLMTGQSAPPKEDALHLLQLAVPSSADKVEAFWKATSAIRNCVEARQIGQSLNAEIVENQAVSLSRLPLEVKALLSNLPTGRATPVFGTKEKTMKVLVICDRKPAQPDGSALT